MTVRTSRPGQRDVAARLAPGPSDRTGPNPILAPPAPDSSRPEAAASRSDNADVADGPRRDGREPVQFPGARARSISAPGVRSRPGRVPGQSDPGRDGGWAAVGKPGAGDPRTAGAL